MTARDHLGLVTMKQESALLYYTRIFDITFPCYGCFITTKKC